MSSFTPDDPFWSAAKRLAPLLLFAVIIIYLLSQVGEQIPSAFVLLIYVVTIGGLAAEVYRRVRDGRTPLPSSSTTSIPVEGTLRPGVILYANVVRYSMSGHREQDRVASLLRKICQSMFELDPRTWSLKDNNYWMKFNGGDFLLYIEQADNEPGHLVVARAFFFSLDFLRRVANEQFKMGITLHWGDDVHYERIGASAEFWGYALDKAQRLMAFSEGGHFFISQEAFAYLERDLFGGRRQGACTLLNDQRPSVMADIRSIDTLPFLKNEDTFHLASLILCDRHHRPHEFFNFYVFDATSRVQLGNPVRPPDWVKIEQRDERRPDDPSQRFVQYLVEADEACIVGLTHEQTRVYLNTALQRRKNEFWKSLQIIFPTERVLKQVLEEKRTFDERRGKWEEGKRKILQFLEGMGPEYLERWSCLEYDYNFTFWGNRLIKKDEKLIRLASLLPGPDLKQLSYLTYYEGTDGYQQLSDALDVMIAGSISIAEWDLLGKFEGGEMLYQGVANRSRLGQLKGTFCMPVVLIMLYSTTLGRLKAFLQRRTIFNAADGFDTYSNISGRLSVNDTAEPGEVEKFPSYILERLRSYRNLEVERESSLATQAFNEVSSWQDGKTTVPTEVWERAAVREIGEELGLTLKDKSRLQFLRSFHLQSVTPNLYFQIYALQVTPDELRLIDEQRPHVNLEGFGLNPLRELARQNRLNRLLQREFSMFETIFQSLGIVDE